MNYPLILTAIVSSSGSNNGGYGVTIQGKGFPPLSSDATI